MKTLSIRIGRLGRRRWVVSGLADESRLLFVVEVDSEVAAQLVARELASELIQAGGVVDVAWGAASGVVPGAEVGTRH